MDPLISEIGGFALRWLHVLFGIAWVGYAYFLLLGWGPVAVQLEAPVRNTVAPKLLARIMPFFRVVAGLTWLTGLLLLGLVYHGGGLMVSAGGGSAGMAIGVGVVAMLFSFFVYDGVYKSPLGAMGAAGAAVCCLLLAGLAFGLSQVMTGRAMFIHLGGTLATIMLMNAAMRLAPAQLKMIKMLSNELPFDPKVAALVTQRATHNVVMSVAVLAFMVSYHLPSAYGHDLAWALGAGIGLLSFIVAKVIVDAGTKPAASPPPAS
jgi:uncharacterized membrane protein